MMNEYDVEQAAHRWTHGQAPNLRAGALVLQRLVTWTNSNSDGWMYWRKPSTAAKRLQQALSDRLYSFDVEDLTEAELRSMLSPIKSFLTRQGVIGEAQEAIVRLDEPTPTDVLGNHLDAICEDAGLGVMRGIFDVVVDREETPAAKLLRLTADDVQRLYFDIVGFAVDGVEANIQARS